MAAKRIELRLPATSANLGPGFDAVGLAMKLYLHVQAEAAPAFSLTATGRNAELIGSLENNLLLETYRALAPLGPALKLNIQNEIPLGMGCGSSAAALLAGVLLASHLGGATMNGATTGGAKISDQQILAEACRREGHPDNVAACWLGGFCVSSTDHHGVVTAASMGAHLPWRLLLALPSASLATSKARALLPQMYSRQDAVANVQATALLVAAFAQDRPELLLSGTRDRMHQPYRGAVCPLLPLLLPLVGSDGIYSVTLSGAGPAVLLCADWSSNVEDLRAKVRKAAADPSLEVLETGIAEGTTWNAR